MATTVAGIEQEDQEDSATFMTRISEVDGQGSHKDATAALEDGDYANIKQHNTAVNKSVVLPNLSIKSPTSKHFRGHSTEDSFLGSSVPKSVSSTRNTQGKQFYS